MTASISNTKLICVQLPISLIHINSLDVLPNSLAQVAAAIEQKRSQQPLHRKKSSLQGRAFAAPVEQSIERQRAVRQDVEDLRLEVDASPRKYQPQLQSAGVRKMRSVESVRGEFSFTFCLPRVGWDFGVALQLPTHPIAKTFATAAPRPHLLARRTLMIA